MEHHSNIVPWQLLAKRTGVKLKFCELTDSQELDMEVGTALGDEPGESDGCIQEGGREPRGIGIQTGMERMQRASRGALKECKDTRGRGEGITPHERGLCDSCEGRQSKT